MISLETLAAIFAWQRQSGDKNSLEIIFHGGEPLLAGADF
jgi:sulfatase maturation enzyme AslB (radical SAM superfamily)